MAARGYDRDGMQVENIGQVFQVLPVHCREVAKNCLQLVLPRINPLIFSFRCSNSNFMIENRFFVKNLSSLDQNTAKSP